MFNSIMYCYLHFDSVDYAPEPKIAETACRYSSSSSECDIFQNRTLCEAEQCRIYKCILLHFSSYVQHTLYTVLQGTFFSPFPPATIFFQLVFSEITRESAWWIQFWSPWCCLLLWHLKVIRI